jgi:ribosome silencing factor RsfS/YbeB/iojap
MNRINKVILSNINKGFKINQYKYISTISRVGLNSNNLNNNNNIYRNNNISQFSSKVIDNNAEKDILENSSPEVSWNWVPPRRGVDDADDNSIPVKKKVLLTIEEIQDVLVKLGGIDIKILNLQEKFDTITEFIIVSGRSTKHLRKMSDVIVQALKQRELTQAPGITGAEGDRDDDWQVVDCYNSAVHFMLPATRQALDLETHWAHDNVRPCINFNKNEAQYERDFSDLLDEHPIPFGYDKILDENAKLKDKNKKIYKKKDSKTAPRL